VTKGFFYFLCCGGGWSLVFDYYLVSDVCFCFGGYFFCVLFVIFIAIFCVVLLLFLVLGV